MNVLTGSKVLVVSDTLPEREEGVKEGVDDGAVFGAEAFHGHGEGGGLCYWFNKFYINSVYSITYAIYL